METFSALLAICAGNSPVPGEFPSQRPVTRIFDVFFDVHLNKQLSKQSWGWWFETLSRPWWRHRNVNASVSWFILYLAQIMACCLLDTELLPEPILVHHRLKFKSKYKNYFFKKTWLKTSQEWRLEYFTRSECINSTMRPWPIMKYRVQIITVNWEVYLCGIDTSTYKAE